MKIPVLIEATSDHRYRATGCDPFAGTVEADTPEAALEEMQKLVNDRVSQGARIASLELPEGAEPWNEGAGMFQDDPLFDEWQRAVADYRREANGAEDTP